MSRKSWTIVAAVVILFVGAYLGSPYWAARQFREAALSADVDRLDAAVDFPAVRESLKSQMTVAMTAKMQNDPKLRDNPFAGLGMMMMPAIVGKMVDGFVTPEGMSALMKRGKLERAGAEPATDPDIDLSYSYRTLDRFAVALKSKKEPSREPANLVFDRRGLFSWKLIRLELPLGAPDEPTT
jgi:hypothetical protein